MAETFAGLADIFDPSNSGAAQGFADPDKDFQNLAKRARVHRAKTYILSIVRVVGRFRLGFWVNFHRHLQAWMMMCKASVSGGGSYQVHVQAI